MKDEAKMERKLGKEGLKRRIKEEVEGGGEGRGGWGQRVILEAFLAEKDTEVFQRLLILTDANKTYA